MAERFISFFIHDGGWFLLSVYLLNLFLWYHICIKDGAVAWGDAMERMYRNWPRFLIPAWMYSPKTLKIFVSLFTVFITIGVILVLVNVFMK